jgi:acetyl esterase/lipase
VTEIRLWEGTAPGSEAATWQEVTSVGLGGDTVVRNVVVPTLTPYLPDPDVANGTAVIVAPGGGFVYLSWENEGTLIAEWLAQRGVAAFVLKYRIADSGETDADYAQAIADLFAYLIPNGVPQPVDPNTLATDIKSLAFADGAQAVRTLRARAAEFGIHDGRLGFLGFSAGAFVATAVALGEDRGARPDFVVPIYGGAPLAPVDADAPPLFSVVAADDVLCFDTTMRTFQAWQAAGRTAELHVYAQGGHGFGAAKGLLPANTWLNRLEDWMTTHGYLPGPSTGQAQSSQRS